MSAEFVGSIRAQPTTLRADPEGGWMIRVEISDVWDVVRIEAAPTTPVRVVKAMAVSHLVSDADSADEFVTKLNGVEILDEDQPLAAVGAENGSTFLVAYRRRRPVR